MVPNLKYHLGAVAAAASSLQSCPTLCDLIDSSPPWKAMSNQKKKKKESLPNIIRIHQIYSIKILLHHQWWSSVLVPYITLPEIDLVSIIWLSFFFTFLRINFFFCYCLISLYHCIIHLFNLKGKNQKEVHQRLRNWYQLEILEFRE